MCGLCIGCIGHHIPGCWRHCHVCFLSIHTATPSLEEYEQVYIVHTILFAMSQGCQYVMADSNVFRHHSECYDSNQSLEIEWYHMQEKESLMDVRCEWNTMFGIMRQSNNDPRDGFFYPLLTPMKDNYNLWDPPLSWLIMLGPSQNSYKNIRDWEFKTPITLSFFFSQESNSRKIKLLCFPTCFFLPVLASARLGLKLHSWTIVCARPIFIFYFFNF